MIRADRTRVAPPDVLTAPQGRGRKETARAITSLDSWTAAGKDSAKWSFEFSAYSDPEVKRRLAEIFYGKCAYCESFYGATQPMDVEHWRPKGQVENADGSHRKPAYYWLAAEWENLLPSCIDCNRRRRQLDALTRTERSIGKEDQFPLADGSTRATARGQEAREEPLLLNPCAEDPADYLVFTDEGVVKSRTPTGRPRERARASIDVYALNRSGLVLTRKEAVRLIKLRVVRIETIVRLLREPWLPEPVELVLDDLLASELRELARMRRDDRPYALMARQLIDRWMESLTGDGIDRTALATPDVPGRAE